MKDKYINTKDFFYLVLNGEYGSLDIDNYIQTYTDNYNLSKLKFLLHDISSYLFYDMNEKEASYTNEQITLAIKKLDEEGKEIPVLKIPNGNILDKEKLLFPHDYFTIHALINKIERLIENCNDNRKKITGFQSKLTDEQIKNLYEKMQGNYFETSPENFKAIFRPVTPIANFKKVVWLKHKTALREFFTLLDITPTQKIIKELISDKEGNKIILPKPKKKEYSTFYATMEKIIISI